MPRLVIDDIEVEVPDGTSVLEAAKVIGITIPHFCYHPALGAVGACRLCAMKFVEGPVKGVQMSCMIKAVDGMVVSTTDGEAARLREMVIEWLMVNHPHDCPVCDEGGMCLLQDYTVAGGHGKRRYRGKKRVFADQYLGEYIQHEMNRCIQCYRCARFYKDYAGGEDFGPMQIANKVYFGRHEEGWLESEFSGNLADVCPTGVFTDKTYRFKARLWDLETAPSVCPHCSLGCNTVPGARYRQLLRVTARESRKVNGWFICDRGRFAHGFASRKDRPRGPVVDGRKAGYHEAMRAAADTLLSVMEFHGPDGVAFLGSPRATLETNYALLSMARAIGSGNVSFYPESAREYKDRRAAARLSGISRPMGELPGSDLIIAAGVDPVNEAPMLALMMRQAVRNGGRVIVIDPRGVKLPFGFERVAARPDELAGELAKAVGQHAAASRRPTVIIGTDAGGAALVDTAADAVKGLRDAGADAGLMCVMSGPNSFGCAMLSGATPGFPGFDKTLAGIMEGSIKALVVAESDPLFSGGEKMRETFSMLDALVVIDHVPTKTAGIAHVVLPCTNFAESAGSYVNSEGRAQALSKVHQPGTPVNHMGPESHPPRDFHFTVPGSVREGWRMLSVLSCMLRPGFREVADESGVDGIRRLMAEDFPALSGVCGLDPLGEGLILRAPDAAGDIPRPATKADACEGVFVLVATELTFGTEELSSYSDKITLKSPPGPYVMVSEDDAKELGLTSGARVRVAIDGGGEQYACELLAGDAARGVAVTPRLPGWALARHSGKTVTVKRI